MDSITTMVRGPIRACLRAVSRSIVVLLAAWAAGCTVSPDDTGPAGPAWPPVAADSGRPPAGQDAGTSPRPEPQPDAGAPPQPGPAGDAGPPPRADAAAPNPPRSDASPDTGNLPRSDAAPASKPDELDIEFDYRFDTSGYFDSRKRALLVAAAQRWQYYIAEGFPDVPGGVNVYMNDPNDVRLTKYYTVDRPVDDVLFFMGSIAEPNGALAAATQAWKGTNVEPQLASLLDARINQVPVQPWVATGWFNRAYDWFLDATPDTSNDLQSDKPDFLSTAVHELGHALGMVRYGRAFPSFIKDHHFVGAKAMQLYGGPVPMEISDQPGTVRTHFRVGVRYRGKYPMMAASGNGIPKDVRLEITALDLAVLEDLGYKVRWDRVRD